MATLRGSKKCSAFGKVFARCERRNHFAKCFKSKKEIKATRNLVQGGEQNTGTLSDSSNEASTYRLQAVNPTGPSDIRLIKTVLIVGVEITELPDSGATVNSMDEAAFKKYGLDKS